MVIVGTDIVSKETIELTAKARSQGVYLIGNTGTGKTTLLQNIAFDDLHNPTKHGLCVIDPHGDLVNDLLLRVPPERLKDVVLYAPGSNEQILRPLGLNLFDCDRSNPREVRRIASTIVDTLKKLFWYSWGPRMEDLLRHSVLTLLPQEETSFLELMLLLTSQRHRERFTDPDILTDPVLRHYWDVQFSAFERDNRMLTEVVGSSLNKIGRFLVDPVIRNSIAQTRSSFSVSDIIKQGKILFVDLSKGHLGEENSRLLGAVIVNLILIAALERGDQDNRQPFHLIVDEFQNFATESFATLQSEARKYNITVTVAHQYRGQLDEQNLGSTLNVGNLIVMRVSGADSYELATQFDNTPPEPEERLEPVTIRDRKRPTWEKTYTSPDDDKGRFQRVKQSPRPYNDVAGEQANKLSIQDNHYAYCRLVVENKLREFQIKTDAPKGSENATIRQAIIDQSVQEGIPQELVIEDIQRRMRGFEFLGSNIVDHGDIDS